MIEISRGVDDVSESTLGVAIVGCGLIGKKRAQSLKEFQLVACVDRIEKKAQDLADDFVGVNSYADWKQVVDLDEIDVVIVATLHASLFEIALGAINARKHVLIEKPGAKSVVELEHLIDAAKKMGVVVRVGFNHRYHRAFREARRLVDAGEIGDLMFIRARYGHGGRIGYDKEWRAQPQLSGGGELIDQGVHLIDLARWFLGDFEKIDGFAGTWFWNMPVDDNGFLLLRTKNNKVAFLHASCTEWKNTFSFEIYGREGKIDINGLGGSYGVEKITLYKMLPEMGPPETVIKEFPMKDDSWEFEITEFLKDIKTNRIAFPGLVDAHAALSVVESIYEESTL